MKQPRSHGYGRLINFNRRECSLANSNRVNLVGTIVDQSRQPPSVCVRTATLTNIRIPFRRASNIIFNALRRYVSDIQSFFVQQS